MITTPTDPVATGPRQLHAVRPIDPLSADRFRHRPQIALSEAALLTNGRSEPTLNTELASEIATCDGVDLLSAPSSSGPACECWKAPSRSPLLLAPRCGLSPARTSVPRITWRLRHPLPTNFFRAAADRVPCRCRQLIRSRHGS